MTNEERIKADAKKAYPVSWQYQERIGYIAGATAEHDRAQRGIDLLQKMVNEFIGAAEMSDKDYDKQLIKKAKAFLEQWKGKEVEPELKEPNKNYNLSTEEKKKLLANKIEARMKEAGLQRQEFADLMGTQPSTITRWLSGEHNFQIDTLFEIEKQLNINLFNY